MNKLILIALMLLGIRSQAQEIDMERMERDIAIAAEILETLFERNDNLLFESAEVQGRYLPNYGIILEIPNSLIGRNKHLLGKSLVGDGGIISFTDQGKQVVFVGDSLVYQGNELLIFTSEDGKTQRQKDSTSVTYRFNGNTQLQYSGDGDQIFFISDSAQISEAEGFPRAALELIHTFYADYGHLISQLPADEKLTLSVSEQENWRKILSQASGQQMQFSLTRQDLDDHQQGKISRQQLIERISVKTSKQHQRKDCQMFSRILHRAYESDLAATYFMTKPLSYEVLEGYGIVFSGSVYSSYSDRGKYSMPTLGRKEVSKAEREKLVTELYPKFEAEFRENLLMYGRTLKDLQPDEQVLCKLEITECSGCGIPKSVEFSLSGKTLSAYSQGKLSLQKALDQVTVKPHGKQ